jgi:hypothetical protein
LLASFQSSSFVSEKNVPVFKRTLRQIIIIMSKKSYNKGGTKSRHSLRPGESTAELKYALKTCSFDQLRSVYLELWPMIEILSKKARRVTDAAMDTNRAARAIIERQLGALPVEPFAPIYRTQVTNELESLGGMKITTCSGNETQRLASFAYTCGFTAVGGKELLIQNVHRSMITPGVIGSTFNFLFKRHNDGHPLRHGSTIQVGEFAFIAETPDRVEATLIKASKTYEPTRLYGLGGYNILLIIPVGTRSADAPENRPTTNEDVIALTYEDVIALAKGYETADGGFKPEANPSNLRLCAWCKLSTNVENKTLKKCSGCNNSFYCSREHQKLDWKQHKAHCRVYCQMRKGLK